MRWLGLDLGDKRTGVAISNPEGTFAVPLLVLQHDVSGPSPAQIDALLNKHEVQGIVLGLPLSLSGSPSTHTHHAVGLALEIAHHLGATLELPAHLQADYPEIPAAQSFSRDNTTEPALRMILWDERLSTWGAQQVMQPKKKRTQGRKTGPAHLDAHAAAIILQSYLESLQNSSEALSATPNDDDLQDWQG
ncbi:MAG: pre-16S rRNA-processing nuclease YqgF [Dehalococcoidia bacterium]|nr:pre-16S rRNA-processing nuclease YqgF [Dehalococcoidia bacterium]